MRGVQKRLAYFPILTPEIAMSRRNIDYLVPLTHTHEIDPGDRSLFYLEIYLESVGLLISFFKNFCCLHRIQCVIQLIERSREYYFFRVHAFMSQRKASIL